MRELFLPVNAEDMAKRGWEQPDFVLVTADAYVDHPSFGHAIIARVLEKQGYKVAILSQPAWRNCDEFKRFGKPRLAFLVSSGNIDSMVNHYTAAKKPRSEDSYSPGGKAGCRPDRAAIVYCNRIREAYKNIPIIIGGLEASLRRFAHYDYWDDKVRNSILVDTGADLILYGMGERSIVETAKGLVDGTLFTGTPIRGSCDMRKELPEGYLEIPSMNEVSSDKKVYCKAFMMQYDEQDPIRGKGLGQKHGDRFLVQHPPQMPLSRKELDSVHTLPFTREWHPDYDALGGVPALEEVKFSVMATRGCFGSCNFCSLTFHQGRIVTSRSPASIIQEVRLLTYLPGFKGYIHDVGGPTANFRKPSCAKQLKVGTCKEKQCLFPSPCKNLEPEHMEFLDLLTELRNIPGVKKVFVRSGIRYDYLLADKNNKFLDELAKHHVSGQLKVAPEHVSPRVLSMMGKPGRDVYEKFVAKFDQANHKAGKEQYLVPYFMSSHPGCDLSDAIMLAEFIRDTGHIPEQVQDFYPTPGTLSTTMFYTGLDPRTLKPVYVPKTPEEKAMQRALMQYKRPANHKLVRKALKIAGREDLIGYDKRCLVRPEQPRPKVGGQPYHSGIAYKGKKKGKR